MPRAGITEYDILASCPNDCVQMISVIEEVIVSFNKGLGTLNNIRINVKHWKNDSYPQSGNKPQELLNQQFVRDCDACIALLWNRFGTPTEKYKSGTEEEIEEMIQSGKQVFLYFVTAPVEMNNMDIDQYQAVQNFKKRYASKGIYFEIKDNEEFRKLLSNHLTLFFLGLISNGSIPFTTVTISRSNISILIRKLMDNTGGKLGLAFRESKARQIVERISSVTRIKPTVPKEENETKLENNPFQSLVLKNVISLPDGMIPKLETVTINEKTRDKIISFCYSNKVAIDEPFWCLGNLKRSKNMINISFFGGSQYTYSGEEEEKKKYFDIIEIGRLICQYDDYSDFFIPLEKLQFVNATVINSGNSFDEDIDIKVFIPKNVYVSVSDLPIPGENIIEAFNDYEFAEKVYIPDTDSKTSEYTDYSIIIQRFSLPDVYPGQSNSRPYKTEKKEYIKRLNRIFGYKIFEFEDFIELCFNISYLKQFTSMNFPSYILMKNLPEVLKYEITSKHSPNVFLGEVTLGNNSVKG